MAHGELAAAFEAGMRARRAVRVVTVADVGAALDTALASATGTGPVVVAGSLYLVGDARARLVDDPALRDP
jgi:folylpolyglutamate synthase/dihydropteroate synthase